MAGPKLKAGKKLEAEEEIFFFFSCQNTVNCLQIAN